ncbi:hypothetical protein ACP70R_039266 [Stipagrostis hirtigluma subsp. patula]
MVELRLRVLAAVMVLSTVAGSGSCSGAFVFEEATVDAIHAGFRNGSLTSEKLVQFYLGQIKRLNPQLRAVIEVNPDALWDAKRADRERRSLRLPRNMHGVPVLVKDWTTSPPRDAGVVARLRSAGAVILGKTNPTEWSNFRVVDDGWSARGGQTQNPYNLRVTPCGPIGRTVSDAVHLLDAIVGYDSLDEATKAASKYIRREGYWQYLKTNGLKGKRIGVPDAFFDAKILTVYEKHLKIMSDNGADVIKGLDISTDFRNLSIQDDIAMTAEFKSSLNAYLSDLNWKNVPKNSIVRSLADLIAFNENHREQERLADFGQDDLIKARAVSYNLEALCQVRNWALQSMDDENKKQFI